MHCISCTIIIIYYLEYYFCIIFPGATDHKEWKMKVSLRNELIKNTLECSIFLDIDWPEMFRAVELEERDLQIASLTEQLEKEKEDKRKVTEELNKEKEVNRKLRKQINIKSSYIDKVERKLKIFQNQVAALKIRIQKIKSSSK